MITAMITDNVHDTTRTHPVLTNAQHNLAMKAARMLGSLLLFTRVMYEARTHRRFTVSSPFGRESHLITICKALTRVERGEVQNLIINVPPRYGKTELIIHFIAKAMARNPQSQFIYCSYAHTLAEKQTDTIRGILMHPDYKALFGLQLSDTTNTKANFETKQGGVVYGAGAGGTLTGMGAGVRGAEGFSGCIIIDDYIKPGDANSDSVRTARNEWFKETLLSRRNNNTTPIIIIGQRVHEADLCGELQRGFDGQEWETVTLPALSDDGYSLYEEVTTTEYLKTLQVTSPYVFYSQYQQTPQPAGGSLYKISDIQELSEEPEMLATFITADGAETAQEWNDATVFTHLGLYHIRNMGIKTDVIGLHIINCVELRVEPVELEGEFMKFWGATMNHKCPPEHAYIEKKSTGTTLLSILQNRVRGLVIIPIERNSNSGSKATRFIQAQVHFGSKLISVLAGTECAKLVKAHLEKITANDTHAHDDIADTIVDGINVGLVRKLVPWRQYEVQSSIAARFSAHKPTTF